MSAGDLVGAPGVRDNEREGCVTRACVQRNGNKRALLANGD